MKKNAPKAATQSKKIAPPSSTPATEWHLTELQSDYAARLFNQGNMLVAQAEAQLEQAQKSADSLFGKCIQTLKNDLKISPETNVAVSKGSEGQLILTAVTVQTP